MAKPQAIPERDVSSAYLVAAAVLFTFALGTRLPLVGQSMWYDELYTLLHYVGQPLKTIVTDFSPNNHPLYSLLARMALFVAGVNDTALRLPAVLAGTILPIALAWPLRKSQPGLAILLGVVAAAQPWLVAFSIEGRGYTLMLLLGLLATRRLAMATEKLDAGYILLLAAAVYTVPIAIILVIGHAAAVLLLHRPRSFRWLKSIGFAVGIMVLLYLPFISSMRHYRAAAHRPSLTYAQFLADVPRYLLIGWSPRENHWFSPDIPTAIAWVIVVSILIGGGVIAWWRRMLVAETITFAMGTAISILAPLLLPDAGEVRFVAWIVPPFVIAVALLLWAAGRSSARFAIAAAVILLSAIPVIGLCRIPASPIFEGVDAAQQNVAESGGTVIGIYMGSQEARDVYRPEPAMSVAYSLDQLKRLEQEKPRPIWAIVFYEQFLTRDRPEMMRHVRANYELVQTLPGRISPVQLYRQR